MAPLATCAGHPHESPGATCLGLFTDLDDYSCTTLHKTVAVFARPRSALSQAGETRENGAVGARGCGSSPPRGSIHAHRKERTAGASPRPTSFVYASSPESGPPNHNTTVPGIRGGRGGRSGGWAAGRSGRVVVYNGFLLMGRFRGRMCADVALFTTTVRFLLHRYTNPKIATQAHIANSTSDMAVITTIAAIQATCFANEMTCFGNRLTCFG